MLDDSCLREPMDKQIPAVRLHLWIETDDGVYFGMGRALLLMKIIEHGSLRKAADDLGMSYRAAWGKIKKSEEITGIKLIEQIGSKREGYRLTQEGMMMLERYQQWFEQVERNAIETAEEIFQWPVKGFEGKSRGTSISK